MAIDKRHDELFDKVRGHLGEHFHNYMFIVMDDNGDMFYDYNNPKVGRMLIYEAHKDMSSLSNGLNIIWEEEEEDGD